MRRSPQYRPNRYLSQVDSPAEKLGNEQLEDCRYDRRSESEGDLPPVPQIHAGNAQQRAEATAPPGRLLMLGRIQRLRRAANCISTHVYVPD